jgi:hypothetical protein
MTHDIRPRPPSARTQSTYFDVPPPTIREMRNWIANLRTSREGAAWLRVNAYHEAGHAVVEAHLNMEFEKIYLCFAEDGGGYITHATDPVAQLFGDARRRWLEATQRAGAGFGK